MFYSTTTFAVLGLATLARSHMMMSTPVPFGKSTLNNSPLDNKGADFPCKQRPGVYDAEGASNTMALGSTQSLSFVGGATHGGGSCQISITYDEKPTTSSTWKVIHSIEGGCPIRNVAGNNGESASAVDPDTYSYTIPASLPTGTAVLAWTWFNKIGNREMYMNCAPITLTAASSKRSDEDELNGNYTMLMERDTAAYNALPNMFVANIPVTSCATVDAKDVVFPDPGDSLEQNGLSTSATAAPTGTACGSVVVGASGTAPASAASSAAGSSAKTSVAPASTASASGGVFITVSPTSSSPALATASVVSSATSVSVAPVSSAVASSPVQSAASTVVASSSTPASTGSSTGASGSGSAIAAGTACTTEGEWNCIGGTSFQQCASGTWSVVQQLAAGTSCTAGETTNINIVAAAGRKDRRAIRFSGSHLRRHIHKA